MAKSKTKTYVLTVQLRVTPAQIKEVHRGQFVSKKIHNTTLHLAQKRFRGLTSDPQWRACAQTYGNLISNKKKLTDQQKAQLDAVSKQMLELKKQYHATEYDLHKDAASVNNHYGHFLGCNEVQKAATIAYRIYESYRIGNCKKLSFKGAHDSGVIENKTNKFGLRVRGRKIIWRDNFVAPMIINNKDKYLLEALKAPTKYVRLITKTIRGKERVYAQILKEGVPPTKGRVVGPELPPIGMDLGTSAVAVCQAGTDKAFVKELPTGINEREENRIVTEQIRAARALRLNNKNCLDKTGGWKKGAKPVKSKTYKKRIAKTAELNRKRSARRKEAKNKLAAEILSMGSTIITEDHSINSWTGRSKVTKVNKKNGKILCKKRYGRSVLYHAPGSLRLELDQRIKTYTDHALYKASTHKVKASQLIHNTGEYIKKSIKTRWFTVDGQNVQRDLYSAFLLSHVNLSTLDKVNLRKCNKDWPAFLNAQELALKNADKSLVVLKHYSEES